MKNLLIFTVLLSTNLLSGANTLTPSSPIKITRRRHEPKEYIKATLKLFKAKKGKTIIEIGSMRNPLNHDLKSGHCNSCLCGHSTLWWALSKAEVYSVDIDDKSYNITKNACKSYSNVRVVKQDGIDFLKKFKKPIDLLFLDAWDVNPKTNYAEMHLDAYLAAKDKLHEGSMILIDDTDIANGGKGRLLRPVATKDGWEIIFTGRQTLFIKKGAK